mmetsp:Transcript_28877/g.43611  ORF Transcript_28877/g.43611 Transcript_28877/m.43611 type:complete len:92 (+) Transcript_28877:1996-2271(+)|eukprot:CAMPEP_0170508370 /NCGR_PEP_ID=MMETSP0208-20121228/62129_1 /TAXON_ID=197538 /ORGANISM="Strombidium inclinatum, Strain S3" /LENGTH=91 /DNA_ID=CAMNT_0010791231 /DNA_START=775 /DNA_END=1050 /DNA_ORIENTATION=-
MRSKRSISRYEHEFYDVIRKHLLLQPNHDAQLQEFKQIEGKVNSIIERAIEEEKGCNSDLPAHYSSGQSLHSSMVVARSFLRQIKDKIEAN